MPMGDALEMLMLKMDMQMDMPMEHALNMLLSFGLNDGMHAVQ
jgi:hypothetical protein